MVKINVEFIYLNRAFEIANKLANPHMNYQSCHDTVTDKDFTLVFYQRKEVLLFYYLYSRIKTNADLSFFILFQHISLSLSATWSSDTCFPNAHYQSMNQLTTMNANRHYLLIASLRAFYFEWFLAL